MLLLKACPHCGGDLALESDRRCVFLECVQCGHTVSRTEERALGVRATPHGLTHLGRRPGVGHVAGATPVAGGRA